MTAEEESKCFKIIHSHAAVAGGGNLIPVPGVGVAADVTTMTTMAMALAAVFGGSIPENVAKNLAISAIKDTVLKQPIKVLGKELSKMVPGLGQIIAPTISIAMLESAGWAMAKDLDAKRGEQYYSTSE